MVSKLSAPLLYVVLAAWAPSPGPVLSGAIEILETNAWGMDYEIPIGEDVNIYDMFDYVLYSLYILMSLFYGDKSECLLGELFLEKTTLIWLYWCPYL